MDIYQDTDPISLIRKIRDIIYALPPPIVIQFDEVLAMKDNN